MYQCDSHGITRMTTWTFPASAQRSFWIVPIKIWEIRFQQALASGKEGEITIGYVHLESCSLILEETRRIDGLKRFTIVFHSTMKFFSTVIFDSLYKIELVSLDLL